MLELCYSVFESFDDTDKLEKFELNTDYLCLSLSRETSENVSFPEKRDKSNRVSAKDCRKTFTAIATDIFLINFCCNGFLEKKLDAL